MARRPLTARLLLIGIWLACVAQVQSQQPAGGLGARPQSAPSSQPAATQPAPGLHPRLELSATEFDFGEVWQGAPAKREIQVKNAGEAELTIGVKSSCGCTVVSKPKSPLAPGESSEFTISYDTRRAGPTHKKVTLTTNDPRQPTVEIPVKGTVKQVFAATPSDRINIQNLETGTTRSETIRLENKVGRPLRLKLRTEEDFGPFDVSLKEIEPGMLYELTVTTKPPLRIGWNNLSLVLETGFDEVPTITIPVAAHAQPRVVAFPSTIAVTPDQTKPFQKIVRVDHPRDRPLKILDLKSSLDSIKWEIVAVASLPAEAPRAFEQIRLFLPAFADFPAEGAKVEILTDDPEPIYQKLVVDIVKQDQLITEPRRRSAQPPASSEPDTETSQ